MATLREIIDYSKKNPDTDYARQAFENIKSGKWDTKAQEEKIDLSFAGRQNYAEQKMEVPEVNTEKLSLKDRLGEAWGDVKETGTAIAGTIKQAGENIAERVTTDDASMASKVSGTLVNAGNALTGVVGDVFTGALKMAVDQGAEDKVKSLLEKAMKGVTDSELAKDALDLYNSLPDEQKRNIDDAIGMASFITDVVGLKVGTAATTKAADLGMEGLVKTADVGIKVGGEAADLGKSAVSAMTPDLTGLSESVIDSVNKMNPTKRVEFKEMTGKSEGEWLRERGIISNREDTVTTLLENFKTIREDVDEALDAIPGNYRDDRVTVVAKESAESAKQMEAPEAKRMEELATKAEGVGLTPKEINEVKRWYERNVKLGYMKDPTKTSEAVSRATNRDKAIREYLFEVADNNGFSNLRELNKEIQANRFLADNIAGKLEGQGSNNMLGLTDNIIIAPALLNPKAVAGIIGKKLLSAEGTKAFFARMLAGFPDKKPLPQADLETIRKRAGELIQKQQDLKIETEKAAILADELQKAGFTMSEGTRGFITDIPVPITRQEQAMIRAAENRASQEQVVQYIIQAREDGQVIGEGFVMKPAEPKYLELPERAGAMEVGGDSSMTPGQKTLFGAGAGLAAYYTVSEDGSLAPVIAVGSMNPETRKLAIKALKESIEEAQKRANSPGFNASQKRQAETFVNNANKRIAELSAD